MRETVRAYVTREEGSKRGKEGSQARRREKGRGEAQRGGRDENEAGVEWNGPPESMREVERR